MALSPANSNNILSSFQLLLRNFIRTKRCVMVLVNAAYYVNSCFDWDSPPRSLAAFVV